MMHVMSSSTGSHMQGIVISAKLNVQGEIILEILSVEREEIYETEVEESQWPALINCGKGKPSEDEPVSLHGAISQIIGVLVDTSSLDVVMTVSGVPARVNFDELLREAKRRIDGETWDPQVRTDAGCHKMPGSLSVPRIDLIRKAFG